jgi:hypothetical protein
MYWWYYPSGRLCPLGHKWVTSGISKDRFEVTEHCNWCGKRRVRGLLPRDEEKRRIEQAYVQGSEKRRRLQYALNYELAKGRHAHTARADELRQIIRHERHSLLDKLQQEKGRGKARDRMRIRELSSELRGLLFGKI